MSRLDRRGRIVSESHRESHDEADKRDPQQRPARRLGVAVGFVECAVTLWCPQLGRAPPARIQSQPRLEAPSAGQNTPGAQGSIGVGGGFGDTASTKLEHLRRGAGILNRR